MCKLTWAATIAMALFRIPEVWKRAIPRPTVGSQYLQRRTLQTPVNVLSENRISGVNECPRNCLCSRDIHPSYKNVRLLSQFTSQQTGMIIPRALTKVCMTQQRRVAKEIRKARQMGFMPHTYKLEEYLQDPKLFKP